MTEAEEQAFESCRKLLSTQLAEGVFVEKDEPAYYSIAIKGDFTFGKRKMDSLFFAAIQKNRSSVVLHFMPIYMNEPLKQSLRPELLRKLKGKTCFHLSKWDSQMEADLQDAFDKAREAYRRMGAYT